MEKGRQKWLHPFFFDPHTRSLHLFLSELTPSASLFQDRRAPPAITSACGIFWCILFGKDVPTEHFASSSMQTVKDSISQPYPILFFQQHYAPFSFLWEKHLFAANLLIFGNSWSYIARHAILYLLLHSWWVCGSRKWAKKKQPLFDLVLFEANSVLLLFKGDWHSHMEIIKMEEKGQFQDRFVHSASYTYRHRI